MRTPDTLRKLLALVVPAVGLVVVIAAWQTRQVQAIQDSEDFPSPILDIAVGQTARLSVVNTRFSPPPDGDQPPPRPDNPGDLSHARRVRLSFDIFVSPPPDPDAPSCTTRFRFARRESCDVVLRSGEGASLDFTATENMKIVASIQSLRRPDTREGEAQLTPEPHLAPTLQVQEGSRTIFVVPAAAKGFNPQPDPPGVP